MPLEDLPDSLLKYKKILSKYSSNDKYIDKGFPSNETSLGEELSSCVTKWERPKENSKIFKDGYSPLDVQQGQIGDCYFMSAISILGKKYLEKNLYLDQIDENNNNCGAFIVKYFVGDENFDVIIDDYFPVDRFNEWAFGHALDENELWPNILEKSYAKFNNGFQNIVGGKFCF